MKNVRQSEISGLFYPCSKKKLISKFEHFKQTVEKSYFTKTNMIIVPHASIDYSGETAFSAFQYLDKRCKNFFVIAASHRYYFEGIAICSNTHFNTTLGDIPLNQKIIKQLSNDFDFVNILDSPFTKEHSIEMEVIFIQNFFEQPNIIPILYSDIDCSNIAKIINKYFDNKDNAFIISSDLSHFYPQDETIKINTITAIHIENLDIEHFHQKQACGLKGIIAGCEIAKKKELNFIRTHLTTSASINSDFSNTVGYGAWIAVENSVEIFIKEHFSHILLDTAKKVLNHILDFQQS